MAKRVPGDRELAQHDALGDPFVALVLHAPETHATALEERPHADWIYRNLTASLYGAGRIEEAKDSFAHLMEIYPDLTVSKIKNAMPFQPRFMDRMCGQLKQLGLPD